MKVAPNLNFTVIQPTQKSLNAFVQMLKNIYQNFVTAFNGNVGFGDGTNPDNINGSWINVTAPVAPNTDFTVNHNLQRTPSGYWIMQKDRACDLYTGSVAPTTTQITFRATVASAVLRIFVVGILLSFFSFRSEAQGVQHYNIALKSTTPSGSSGIGGAVAQPINGASITVCLGSVAPSPGTTCNPTTNIFSNAGLTNALSNPFNADVNGNYTFFAAGGVQYVVSVGGVGLTTFSYVWSAPINTSANLTLASLNVTGLTTLSTTNVASLTSSGAVTGTAISGTSMTDSGLTSGNCVQATTGGLLTTASGPCGTSSGTITATGSPAAGNLTKFSGATSITNGDLSGDVTTSGTTTATVAKVNGVSYPASPSTNQVPVVTAGNVATYETIPGCLDSAGNHLNYNNSTFTFTCGTTSPVNTGRQTSVCSTSTSSYATCTSTVTWAGFTFANTNYSASCTGVGPSGFPAILGISKATGSVTVTVVNGTSNGAVASTYSELDCIGE